MSELSSSPAPSLRGLSVIMLSFTMMLFSAGCSLFGVESVEEASYQRVHKDDRFEIRDYATVVVAETRVNAEFKDAGSKAFRKLFAYISGENEGSRKIAMTAPVIADAQSGDNGESIAMTSPVVSEQEGNGWRYRFVLPQSYTIDTAPTPLDPDVTLVEITQKRVATLRYSGRATAKAQALHADRLDSWIVAQGLASQSAPRWAGYNPPWTLPWFRRNEVLIDVSTTK